MRSSTTFVILLLVQVSFICVEASVRPEIAGLLVPKATVGAEVTLICSLASGTKPVQFRWMKDRKEVPSSLITNQATSSFSSLVINSVKTEDRGRYSCLVKNAFGEDSKSADLIVTGQSIS